MTLYSTDARVGPINPASPNPTNIASDIVAITNQLQGSGAPSASLGVVGNVYTDVSTGNQYQKDMLGWHPTIALGSFAVIPDPLHVDTIEGRTGQNVIIDLQTTGSLQVGPTGSFTQVTIGSDGTIVTDSATSAVIVADGSGHQTGYQPQQIVCTDTLEIIGNSGLQLLTNAGNLTLAPAGVVITDSQIQTNVGGAAYASVADPLSGFGAQVSAANLIVNSTPIVNATASAVNVTQPILSSAGGIQYSSSVDTTSGFTSGTGSTTMTSGGVANIQGTASTLVLTPVTSINNSTALTDPRYFGADEAGIFGAYKPYNVLIGSPYTVPAGSGTYPVDFNGMSGGFSQAIYYDGSYTIKKVAICMNINAGTFTFGGGTASLQVGHYVVNAAQTAFVTDYTLALSTGGNFWQQSSGIINIPVTGPVNLAVQLFLSGVTIVGVPNSFTVSLFLEGN